jgi:hypothetical protein
MARFASAIGPYIDGESTLVPNLKSHLLTTLRMIPDAIDVTGGVHQYCSNWTGGVHLK